MPPEFASAFDLHPGERVLWVGKPSLALMVGVSGRIIRTIIGLVIVCLAVLMFALVQSIKTDQFQHGYGSYMSLMNSLLMFIMPALIVFFAALLVFARRRTARATYILTSERAVFLCDGLIRPSTSLDLSECRARLIPDKRGFGSIVFEPQIVMTDFGSAPTSREHGFLGSC